MSSSAVSSSDPSGRKKGSTGRARSMYGGLSRWLLSETLSWESQKEVDRRRLAYMRSFGDLKKTHRKPVYSENLTSTESLPSRGHEIPAALPAVVEVSSHQFPQAYSDRHLCIPETESQSQSSECLSSNDEVESGQDAPAGSRCCENNQHLPILTYIICAVHLALLIGLLTHSHLAPVGLTSYRRRSVVVRLPNLTVAEVCWVQYGNMWIGPTVRDLIRFGALYPPCMRFDSAIDSAIIETQKAYDRASGCCLLRGSSACYQTSRARCNGRTSQWLSYHSFQANIRSNISVQSANSVYGSTKSVSLHLVPEADGPKVGPVCGLDPEFCLKPLSRGLSSWSSEDVTKWPVCEQIASVWATRNLVPHMRCAVTAHPCCAGLRGECILTTKQHCDAIGGLYNAEASLCSQVNCLGKICGMQIFSKAGRSDQLYRLLTSLFIHSGFIHLGLSICIHLTLMCSTEKQLGWFRSFIIYLVCGCFGNLLSCILMPYNVVTGPFPSLAGFVGWNTAACCRRLCSPNSRDQSVRYRVGAAILLFLAGLLPWQDNFANLGGFISGLLFFFTFESFKKMWATYVSKICPRIGYVRTPLYASRKRFRLLFPTDFILLVLFLITFLTSFLMLIFGRPLKCSWCRYISCIPILPGICHSFPFNVTEHTECIEQT